MRVRIFAPVTIYLQQQQHEPASRPIDRPATKPIKRPLIFSNFGWVNFLFRFWAQFHMQTMPLQPRHPICISSQSRYGGISRGGEDARCVMRRCSLGGYILF